MHFLTDVEKRCDHMLSSILASHNCVSIDDLFNSPHQKAKDKVNQTLFQELYRYQVVSSNLPIVQELNSHREKRNKEKEEKQESQFYFITICPIDTTPLPEFHNAIKRYVSKKCIKQYLYVIEQRGIHENEVGKGIHAHIICNKEKNLQRMLKETRSTFKGLYDENCTSAIDIDIRFERDRKNTEQYLIGKKHDINKQVKQQVDTIFRGRYNLQPYYTKNYIPINIEDAPKVLSP